MTRWKYNEKSLPIDISGNGLHEVTGDKIGELLLDALVNGDGKRNIDCLLIIIK